MSTCVSFRPLHNRSFEAVEMWLSLDHVSIVHLYLYQLPLSKCNNLTNSMLLEAFPTFLPQFTNKTEVMPVGSASRLGLVDHECANISGNSVPSKTSVKHLKIHHNQTLSMRQHADSVCRTLFLELRRAASIRLYLSQSAIT